MRIKTRKNFRQLTQYRQQIHKNKKKERNIGQEIIEGVKEMVADRLKHLEELANKAQSNNMGYNDEAQGIQEDNSNVCPEVRKEDES